MARARNIKPAIFKNELLGVADPLLTLLFQSLWTLADREGRLEDRPLRIKAETFPYRDNLDINGYLTELQRLGFIVRYCVGENALIQVVNFKKHQTPHNTEKPSELPQMESEAQINKGFQGAFVKQPLSDGENVNVLPPDSLLLIPDSLNPLTSSLIAKKTSSAKAPKATKKCPDDFLITESMRDWAISEGLLIDIDAETRVFKDHTFTSSKSDWLGTWRNWIRRANGFKPKLGVVKQSESFKEKDAKAARELYERVTGKQHPENALNGLVIESKSHLMLGGSHELA